MGHPPHRCLGGNSGFVDWSNTARHLGATLNWRPVCEIELEIEQIKQRSKQNESETEQIKKETEQLSTQSAGGHGARTPEKEL